MSISNPPNYGTPDWQRGYYSAQKLLADVPAGTHTTTITVPPNAETIVIQVDNSSLAFAPSVVGVQTGIHYAPQFQHLTTSMSAYPVWFVDMSSTVDQEVTITFLALANFAWYVYADAGVHITFDTSKAVNEIGEQYVVPCVPSALPGDHPANELEIASMLDSPNGTALVPAPGAGNRLRVFDAFLNSSTPTNFVALRTSATGVQIIGISSNNASTGAQISGLPSGIPMPTNEGINIITSAGDADGTVVYSVEAV